jgi:Arm DNA-binding domain
MRSKLTPAFAAKAATAPGASRTVYWDVSLPCFGLMVTTNGRKSYVVQYRAAGRSRRLHLKQGLTLRAARKEAMAILGAVAKGGDPLGERRNTKRAESDTLRAIVEEYLTREGGRLRSIAERRRALEHHVLPKLGARQIGSITRSDIVRLLDRIADNSGAPMADHVLAYLRRVMTWHATQRRFPLAGRARHGTHTAKPTPPPARPIRRRNQGRVAVRRGFPKRVRLPSAVPAADGNKTHRSSSHAAQGARRRRVGNSARAL